jgi:hypothetical protein
LLWVDCEVTFFIAGFEERRGSQGSVQFTQNKHGMPGAEWDVIAYLVGSEGMAILFREQLLLKTTYK